MVSSQCVLFRFVLFYHKLNVELRCRAVGTSTPPMSLSLSGANENFLSIADQEIDEKIVDWVSAGPRHACVVEEKEFQDLLHLLAPNYKVPAALTVAGMINSRYVSASSELQVMLAEASRTSKIALSIRFISDAKRCLVLQAHFVTSSWTTKSLTIGCHNETSGKTRSSESVAKWINDKMQDFYILSGAIVAVVHCNDISVQNGVNILAEAYGWHTFICCRSVLRLVTEKLYKESFVSEGLDEIEKIVQFFSCSDMGKILMQRASEKNTDSKRTENQLFSQSCKAIPKKIYESQDKDDFVTARSLLKVLHPLDAALSYLNTNEFIHSSSIPVLLSGLEKKLCSELDMPVRQIKEEDVCDSNTFSSLTPTELENKLKLKLLFELRKVTTFKPNDVTTISAALDPRYKKLSFINADEKQVVYSMISAECFFLHKNDSNTESTEEEPPPKILVKEVQSKACKSTLLNDIMKLGAGCQEEDEQQDTNQEVLLNRIKKEMDNYFAEKLPTSDVCPLSWWHANQSKYPMMSEVARLYLCIPAISGSTDFYFNNNFVTPICNHVLLCKADKILIAQQ